MGEQLHTTPILYNRDNHQFLGETTQGFLRKFLYNMHFFASLVKFVLWVVPYLQNTGDIYCNFILVWGVRELLEHSVHIQMITLPIPL